MDVNLFAGSGGLALGLRRSGFSTPVLYEVDRAAQQTLQLNGIAGGSVEDWTRCGGDVRLAEWSASLSSRTRLLAGGVPCQPFSHGGKHRADQDARNLFPEFFRAAAELRPEAMLVENVGGLLRTSFRGYFEYLLRRFENPLLKLKRSEPWQKHDMRLRAKQCEVGYEPTYLVSWRKLNAADYGVPQQRRRVFFVAVRHSIGHYQFPSPTHSQEALRTSKARGDYYRRHGLAIPESSPQAEKPLTAEPWNTVRDAIADLPSPASNADAAEMNHWNIPGARSYKGHTGSQWDEPAKTLKAGVHGVPGGENTLTLGSNGKVRYFTLREAARLQTFPDSHVFHGSRVEMTRQIGNAVPVLLAETVARPLVTLLGGAK